MSLRPSLSRVLEHRRDVVNDFDDFDDDDDDATQEDEEENVEKREEGRVDIIAFVVNNVLLCKEKVKKKHKTRKRECQRIASIYYVVLLLLVTPLKEVVNFLHSSSINCSKAALSMGTVIKSSPPSETFLILINS